MAYLCKLRKCKYYKDCKKKKNPFENNSLCIGYQSYVTQDAKRKKGTQIEMPISHALEALHITTEDIEEMYNSGKTIKQHIVQMFFFDGEDIKTISKELACTEQYVYAVIRHCKKLLLAEAKKKRRKRQTKPIKQTKKKKMEIKRRRR